MDSWMTWQWYLIHITEITTAMTSLFLDFHDMSRRKGAEDVEGSLSMKCSSIGEDWLKAVKKKKIKKSEFLNPLGNLFKIYSNTSDGRWEMYIQKLIKASEQEPKVKYH